MTSLAVRMAQGLGLDRDGGLTPFDSPLMVAPLLLGCLVDQSTEALIFSVYLAAVTSMTSEQCRCHLGEDRHTAIQRYRFFVEQATDWLLKKLIDQRMADRKRVVNVRQRIRCKLLYGAYVFLIFFPPTDHTYPLYDEANYVFILERVECIGENSLY